MSTRTAGTSLLARRRSWLVSPLVALLFLIPVGGLPAGATEPAGDTEPICTPDSLPPGTNGCLPTPLECATGKYNGLWQGEVPGRAAFCLGGGGHVAHYGMAGGGENACGTLIEADQLVIGGTGWHDPNICSPASNPPGYGVEGRAFLPAESSSGGVVASVSPEAADAGIEVLGAGGNAMDAAVATVFAVGVTRPDMCGIGGGGFLVYRSANGEVATLDFREEAPEAVTPTTLEGDGIHASAGAGHRVVGVPGTVAGMAAAAASYGTRPLADLIAPAEQLAREGIPVSPGLATFYGGVGPARVGPREPQAFDRLRMFPEAASIYLRNGLQYPPDNPQADSTLVQKDYARSLALVATFGPDAFYEDRDYQAFEFGGHQYPDGPSIGRLILDDMAEARARPMYQGDDPAEWRRTDLSEYEAIWRDPLRGTYRGHQIFAMGPPSAGGILTLEMLNILEGYDVASMGHSSADYFHFFAEAQKIAWADRTEYVADPDLEYDFDGDGVSEPVPTDLLTNKGYAAQRRAEIDPSKAQAYGPGSDRGSTRKEASPSSPNAESRNSHTTHVSVIDGDGNAVAVTCTIGYPFGSAVVAPGTGFLLNNHLLDFDKFPNEADGGKRPRSSATPTIVVKGGRAILAIGGGGGPLIPNGVILGISNVVDFGMDVAHALDAARFFEFECCVMTLEDGRVLPEVEDDLVGRGHEIGRYGEYAWFGPVIQAVGFDPGVGLNTGASDPREDWGVTAQT